MTVLDTIPISKIDSAENSEVEGRWEEAFRTLSAETRAQIRRGEPMRHHTSLRVGGPARYFIAATNTDRLAEVATMAQRHALPHFVLGAGSNVCVSDAGIPGLVIQNLCNHATIGVETYVDTGHNLMHLFLRTMRAELSGMEFAVGIPGTVDGALVSNAGAYRANICDLVRRVEVVEQGERKWVDPEWMEFSYRDSRLRRDGGRPAMLLSVLLALTPAPKAGIRMKAKDLQMQRLLKQPWEPSAGSFFKNVNDLALAQSLPALPAPLQEKGIVPAGYLSEACGCKGLSVGGAAISPQHGNFLVNRGNATATDVHTVAEQVKRRVFERFGVLLEEEVLYVGAW